MALRFHTFDDVGVPHGQASQNEKGSSNVFSCEEIEQPRRDLRMRPVVKRQAHGAQRTSTMSDEHWPRQSSGQQALGNLPNGTGGVPGILVGGH
jgi:hypothetical protein